MVSESCLCWLMSSQCVILLCIAHVEERESLVNGTFMLSLRKKCRELLHDLPNCY